MKAIEHSEFAPTTDLGMDEWARGARKALKGLRNSLRMLTWLMHREPGFRERHLLDGDLGAEIRRSTW